jgi:peptide/nickel transport system substrate-binding protein
MSGLDDMRHTIFRLLAAVSLLSAWQAAGASGRPRYGGTLRVEVRESVRSLNPAECPGDALEAALQEKLVSLVFESLVRLDETGRPQPLLALSWQHDSDYKRWGFRLRPNLKFHDGSDATPQAVAAGLRRESDSLRFGVAGEELTVESDQPDPDLLFDLAQASRSVFSRGADLEFLGTGPFRVAQWDPGRRAVLVANEQHWAGRPFLDAVTIEMGRPLREQMLDLELGRADFVEISPGEVRRIAQRGTKIWSSSPDVLIALVFGPGRPASEDARFREAVALSIDRAAMYSVLLQKMGEPATALLPQGLSGYAYLFPDLTDVKKARELSSSIGQSVPPRTLGCDFTDPLARSIADRIAVNARDAGVRLQVSAQENGSDLRLVRVPLRPPLPGPALSALLTLLHLPGLSPPADRAGLESVYASERAAVDSHQVIPLFHIPETFGSSPRLRTWKTPGVTRSGVWCFDDLWLDVEMP